MIQSQLLKTIQIEVILIMFGDIVENQDEKWHVSGLEQ